MSEQASENTLGTPLDVPQTSTTSMIDRQTDKSSTDATDGRTGDVIRASPKTDRLVSVLFITC